MFAQVNPNFYTSCKNDAEICSGSGGEADPCEGDTPDPETDYFCTADIPDGQDQKKPWVKCSNECFKLLAITANPFQEHFVELNVHYVLLIILFKQIQ